MSRFSSIARVRAAAASVVFLGAGLLALPADGHGHGGRGGGAGHGEGGGHSADRSSFAAGHAAPGVRGRIAGGRGVPRGYWSHGIRGGQPGWWWVGAGGAYLYAPGYSTYVPGGAMVEPAFRYYCNILQGYYPDVQNCPEPWVIVEPGAY